MSSINNNPNSMASRSYSSSITPSKYQTPIKSPSPDQARMNALTPTKVKYICDNPYIKGYDNVQNYQTYNPVPYRQTILHSHSQAASDTNLKNNRNSQEALTHSQSQRQSSINYTKELEQQIQILTIQNKNLVNKLKSEERIGGGYQSSSGMQPHPPRRSANSQVIQKIKQQYEQKINTLKLMIQQQIKQAMDVVQDMCDLLRNKMNATEQRVEGLQQKIHQFKLNRILKIQNAFNKTNSPTKMQNPSNHSSPSRNRYDHPHNFGENSISDILCVSIPEEEEEESKNYTVTITKLEDQIEKLKKMINETQSVYFSQKQYLNNLIFEKNQQIKNLTEKLENSERKKQNIQWKYQTSIKDQLKMLQQNVFQLAKQLAKSQRDYDELIVSLQNKNIETQTLNQQLIILRDKNHDSERQTILLQQKIKYLQGNVTILQQQLKERTKLLNQTIMSKTILQKQRIAKITSQTNKHLAQNNVMTLTARIDKLLLLQQQRQLKQKQFYETEIEQHILSKTYY